MAGLAAAGAGAWAGPAGAAPDPGAADLGAPNAGASDSPPRVALSTVDGRRFEGELIRDVPSHVLLRIGGLEARFERAEVRRLSPVASAAGRLLARRAALADDDRPGRLALAREMFAADLLDAARWELLLLQAAAPEVGPERDRVDALLAAVQARRALQDAPSPAAEADPAAHRPDPARDVTRARSARPVYLSAEAINLVRVYEIDLNTLDPGRVEVPELVLREAMDRHPTHPAVPTGEAARARLLGASGRDQLTFLFALEARSLYGQVRVRQDPETLAAFRREFNPGHVARYFDRHFGGGRVPGLNLVRYRPNTTAEAYTNFVALCRFQHGERRMIDRYNPEASLLLQWALPREEARHPAPDVPGWRPRFRSLRDARCVRLRDWIDGLVKFDPDYAALFPSEPSEPTEPSAAADAQDQEPAGPGEAPPAGRAESLSDPGADPPAASESQSEAEPAGGPPAGPAPVSSAAARPPPAQPPVGSGPRGK